MIDEILARLRRAGYRLSKKTVSGKLFVEGPRHPDPIALRSAILEILESDVGEALMKEGAP